MAEILIYTGTILIGFELIRDISHLPTLAIILWWKLFEQTFVRGNRLIKECPKRVRGILRVALIMLVSPIVVLAVSTALCIVAIWLVGAVIIIINDVVNKIYRREIKRMREGESPLGDGKIFRFFLPGVEDKTIDSAIEKTNVRFMAIIGTMLVSAGFIYILVNR